MSGAAGLRGPLHWAWNGGRHRYTAGYIGVRAIGHPKADMHGYVYEHILVAERALGRHLPERAQVHHVNEKKSDNSNGNLVVCQDYAYHSLLHQRMRALRACGNPNWLRCRYCKGYDDVSRMSKHQGNSFCHAACKTRSRRENRRRS